MMREMYGGSMPFVRFRRGGGQGGGGRPGNVRRRGNQRGNNQRRGNRGGGQSMIRIRSSDGETVYAGEDGSATVVVRTRVGQSD